MPIMDAYDGYRNKFHNKSKSLIYNFEIFIPIYQLKNQEFAALDQKGREGGE